MKYYPYTYPEVDDGRGTPISLPEPYGLATLVYLCTVTSATEKENAGKHLSRLFGFPPGNLALLYLEDIYYQSSICHKKSPPSHFPTVFLHLSNKPIPSSQFHHPPRNPASAQPKRRFSQSQYYSEIPQTYLPCNTISTGEREEKALSWRLQRCGAEGNVRVNGALSVVAVIEKLPPHSMGGDEVEATATVDAEGW
ncbi:hypothetical protein BDP27DRAFT_1366307 [Rhodocollybia butyracea]|uniref:Uncharacterized protein n=1 Tax=Rhodocollybia butyracea TaxID=206335 RepID=A0A9P5U4H3_9AGAR|nr:hypothetical protein BDP27DRAFT_1366307 [Rhodocollybia butyracea]